MIRSRWFCAMNSRGNPWRPAGNRGEEPAGAASFFAFFPSCAVPFATHRRYPLAQRLDQQLVLRRARTQVRHHRHVDELREKVVAALDGAGLDLRRYGAVDRAGDDFGGAAGDLPGLLELLAAAVEDV